MKPRIRVVRPFGPFELETENAYFSTAVHAEEADALLCEWAPDDAMLTFQGPSAWYTAEARTNPRIGVLAHPDQRRFLDLLRPEQMLYHAHPDPLFRVPHMTHASLERTARDGPRERAPASVVSNYGGPLHNRGPEIRLRNAFVTAPGVHLYGRRSKWKHYRARWWSWPSAPASYRGEVDDVSPDKIDVLARFHTAICMENTSEPWYFSEKFVDGVRAGCVPVYHAHASVRTGVLAGASWVDPRDHGMDVRRTLEHALSLDREEVARTNFTWLDSEGVRETSQARVWSKIAEALQQQSQPGES